MKLATRALALSVLSLAGCGEPQADDAPSIQERSAGLWLIAGANLWPRSGTGPANIRVCFNGTNFNAAQRDAIRLSIEDSWERVANINFHDWGVCPNPAPTSNAIIVKHDPNLGAFGVSDGGKILNRANNIVFFSASPDRKTTIHEFGHALGFMDENTSGVCSQNSGGTSLENENDFGNSVMTQSICNDKATLSAWDILGVRRMYGLKPPRTIAGPRGLAMSIAGGSATIGAAIVGAPAQGAEYDKWLAHPVTQQLRASAGGAFRCANVQGGTVSSGLTPLISWSCDSGANEVFHFTGVQWRAMGNMCVGANSNVVGANLSLQACASSVLQRWDFFEGGATIRLIDSNLCVQVPNGSTALGTLLRLATCSGASDQSFSKQAGRILWGDKCFSSFGGTTAVGSKIGLWDGCGAEPPLPNEVFTIWGKVTGLGGQCVTLPDGAPVDGVQLGMSPCQAPLPPSQSWETYF